MILLAVYALSSLTLLYEWVDDAHTIGKSTQSDQSLPVNQTPGFAGIMESRSLQGHSAEIGKLWIVYWVF